MKLRSIFGAAMYRKIMFGMKAVVVHTFSRKRSKA
jgi:hypothetical protein